VKEAELENTSFSRWEELATTIKSQFIDVVGKNGLSLVCNTELHHSWIIFLFLVRVRD
jgi:hypothetical protein